MLIVEKHSERLIDRFESYVSPKTRQVARPCESVASCIELAPGGKTEPPAQGVPRHNSRMSMKSSASRNAQEQSGGGALAEALRRASEKSGSGKARDQLEFSRPSRARIGAYGRNACRAYSLRISNLVQHLSKASMAALPHLRKSLANGLNKFEGTFGQF